MSRIFLKIFYTHAANLIVNNNNIYYNEFNNNKNMNIMSI